MVQVPCLSEVVQNLYVPTQHECERGYLAAGGPDKTREFTHVNLEPDLSTPWTSSFDVM